MKNIRLFETETEMNEAVIEECSVSYVIENNKVYTTPENGGQGGVDYSAMYTTFEALEDGLTIRFSENFADFSENPSEFEYRIDNGEWYALPFGETTPSINTGQNIQFKNDNPLILGELGIGTFVLSKKCKASGNIMSLHYGDDFIGKTDLTGKNNAFTALFAGSTNLIDTVNLQLPATTLSSRCYQSMFYDCSSLTTAPILPATTLAEVCYDWMFNGCSKLNNITMLATDISAEYCLNEWVSGVASTGTFVKHPDMTSLPTGESGIPEGWTVVDYSSQSPA